MHKYKNQFGLNRRRAGWLMIEMLVALWVVAAVAAGVTAVALSAGKGNRMLWARREALSAVEAQLDCLSHTAAALPAEQFEQLWPDFEYAVDIVPGEGPTAGVDRATVTVTGRVRTKTIRVTGSRYIAKRGEQ